MVLCAIGSGYVWQNGEKEPAKVIICRNTACEVSLCSLLWYILQNYVFNKLNRSSYVASRLFQSALPYLGVRLQNMLVSWHERRTRTNSDRPNKNGQTISRRSGDEKILLFNMKNVDSNGI